MDDDIGRDQDQQGKPDADEPGKQPDQEGLRVEDLGDIPLGSADTAQDTDLLLPLEHADVSDDADHDR